MKYSQKVQMILTGLMAALCYVGFAFLRIDIPTPGGSTAFHLGNAFCILAALLLGGVRGGTAGAVGMGIADVLSGTYVMYAPKTVFLKFFIGFICGFIAHKIGKINDPKTPPKKVFIWSGISSAGGMLFNVIFEPIFSFFYAKFVLGVTANAAKILVSWTAVTTLVNAVLAVVVAVGLYKVMRPIILKKVQ